MNYRNTKIESKRLLLIPITFDHTDVIFNNFTKDITEFMYPQPSGNKKNTIVFIESSIKTMEEGSNLQFVIKHKDTDEFLGNIGLHHIDTDTPEFGIWLKKGAHGCAYGYEAITALLEFARKNLEFKYIKYPVDRNNVPSRKIPLKLQAIAKKEYIMTNTIGKDLDIVEYWIYK